LEDPQRTIAMMRDEVVHRRGWLTDERFLDLLGATNLRATVRGRRTRVR
jgi:chromate transport protein ChrA